MAKKQVDGAIRKRNYTVSDKVVEHNRAIALKGQQASALQRKANIQDKLADRLEKITDSMTDVEIEMASFRDKATATGIFYDKLYRDQHQLPHNAMQVNIQIMGQDANAVEPLMVDINPKPIDTDVSTQGET